MPQEHCQNQTGGLLLTYQRPNSNVIHHRVGHPIESAIYAKTYLFSPTTPNAITKPC
jgi:hypothetical protein